MKEPRTKGWWLINLALTVVGTKGLREMTRASKNGKKAQFEALKRILDWTKDTVYGREHHFEEILAAKKPEEMFSLYRKNVPVNDYEDLRPYIDRHKNGEQSVLLPGKPRIYSTTSGTTREPKWIPVAEKYFRDVYKKMNEVWFYTLLKNKPKVFHGPGVSIVGKAIEGYAPDGTVYGSQSGLMARDIPNIMKRLHTAPPDVFLIADYKARYYAIMRMGIERDTHLIVAVNPSTLVEMQTNANEFFDDYCDDIEHGTVGRKFDIPDEIRSVMEAYTKPNPARASELRALKERYGTVLPKHYWPNLQVVNTWFCGNTKIYLEKVKDSFPPDCAFIELGYLSSECKAGVPLESGEEASVVFGNKFYFEFIHEADLENPNPKIHQLYELKKGERYNVLVTTISGLQRYNMTDLVEVTGYYNQFPMIKYIQKTNGTTSLTGEKLHERQFIEAMHETQKETGKTVPFFAGFADIQNSNYKFYYEFADQNTSQGEAEAFTVVLDKYLREYNPEYRDKRASNRLKAPETALLGPESLERFKVACIEAGYRDGGQFKFNLLMQDEKRHAMFKALVKN